MLGHPLSPLVLAILFCDPANKRLRTLKQRLLAGLDMIHVRAVIDNLVRTCDGSVRSCRYRITIEIAVRTIFEFNGKIIVTAVHLLEDSVVTVVGRI